MTINIRSIIETILSQKEAKNGLHVNVISTHIFNETIDLFEDPENGINYDLLKKKVNGILAAEVKKKKGGKYLKVINPKTGKGRRGFYKLKFKRGS
ncbi:MAG: hypothetical protein WCJ95_03855 [Mariniphaga sp.]